MKKLVTAACALAAGLAMADGVMSTNVVGYFHRETTGGYDGICAGFQKVGGGETHISDVIDTTSLTPYVSDIMVYDPVEGTFTQWIWDGTGFTDWVNTTDPVIALGSGFLSMLDADVTVKGEVVNPDTLIYQHTIPVGYSFVGSAFPMPFLQSNCNFAETLTAYASDVMVYDPVEGTFTQWLWDGTGFTDWVDYLPDQLAPRGGSILFGNPNETAQVITEDINPKQQN